MEINWRCAWFVLKYGCSRSKKSYIEDYVQFEIIEVMATEFLFITILDNWFWFYTH